jgi:hypothetical protein
MFELYINRTNKCHKSKTQIIKAADELLDRWKVLGIGKGTGTRCTEENLPFSHFNSEAFRLSAGPHADALGITINATNMPARVKSASNAIRNQITAELKDTLFSVKVDAATKLERRQRPIRSLSMCGRLV